MPTLSMPLSRRSPLKTPSGNSRIACLDGPWTPKAPKVPQHSESNSQIACLDGPWTPKTPKIPQHFDCPPTSFPSGSRGTKLEIFEQIGSGATSTVFRGKFNGKPAAVKQINSNACFTEWLGNELSILSSLTHPNVVRLLSTVQEGTKTQIITELCEGGDVFHLLHVNDHVDLSWKQTIKMSYDTARAMEYLHALSPSIIHGDLKSLNLLLLHSVHSSEDACIVKVADFGCAAMDNRSSHLRRIGTSNWMAPEVFSSDTYDISADVFSYGMVLFELIYREAPFEDVEQSKISSLVLNGERPNLEGMPPDCPEPLHLLMRRCWAQLPADRPCFVEVCQALHMLLIAPSNFNRCSL